MNSTLAQRLLAEALGTALLVATVVGSGIMAETLTKDVALALLGNTLATGAILVVLITILGPISGAHFNPAVSLVFALKRELGRREAALYVVAQLTGGVAGSIEVNRRARRAKTDRIDLERLMRAFLAHLRGEPKACSIVNVPSPAEEDDQRSHRDRERLLKEGPAHTNAP